MGKTVIEKIITFHCSGDFNCEATPGSVVWMDLDVRTARDFGGPNVVKNLLESYESDRVADPGKTFFTFDTVAPANNIPYAQNQQICRKFAAENGIRVFDVNSGIGTHTLMEKGIVLPGYTAVGTDSHYNILGAINAFGQGMGDIDIAFAFKTGKTWLEVPSTVRVNLIGMPTELVSPKDVVLRLLQEFGASSLLGKTVELYGDYVTELSMDGRITIASMATEMGLITIFPEVSDRMMEFCKQHINANLEAVQADEDARYDSEYNIEIGNLKPLLAAPFHPHNVHEVSEYEGVKVDSVFLGSCTNGRIDDLEAAMEVLDGKRIKDGVMFKVVPSTRKIYQEAMERGILEKLFNAGAIISHAACAGCASGQLGMTGEDEVQLSTANRNFKGKQGKGKTFLVSPATAAISALEGKITVPV
ncbi:3-isopropylmalate dehydratase large subunit [bacterium]|nr:3-isopropylmalate dehydratase large subunit [bacterium]